MTYASHAPDRHRGNAHARKCHNSDRQAKKGLLLPHVHTMGQVAALPGLLGKDLKGIGKYVLQGPSVEVRAELGRRARRPEG